METQKTYYPEETVIRIDDISINSDLNRLTRFLEQVRQKYPAIQILLAVSPLVFDMHRHEPGNFLKHERVFPSILNAMSDHREFYKVEKAGIPDWLPNIVSKYSCILATHGLLHIDHRLLSKELQELSLVTSASLVGTKIFVPPFNKYNEFTKTICEDQKILLVRWEDGWTHLGYHPFKENKKKYYVHLHDYPGEELFDLIL